MLVEAHGLRVLLVHGELGDAETLDLALKEPPADSPSADGGVEEEHLQAAVRRRVLGLIFYALALYPGAFSNAAIREVGPAAPEFILQLRGAAVGDGSSHGSVSRIRLVCTTLAPREVDRRFAEQKRRK